MSYPNSPTGAVAPRSFFERCLTYSEKYGTLLVSDEAYIDIFFTEEPPPSLLQVARERVVAFFSLSKRSAMTGWRVGWLIVPEDFINPVEKLAQNIFISTPTHSQYAALAAFSEESLFELENRRQAFEKRRDFLYTQLQKLGFDIAIKPEGAFYIYANCARFTDDSFQFAKDLLEQEGVAVTPGKDFGNNQSNNYIRFAYTASIAKMSLAMERLERFICR